MSLVHYSGVPRHENKGNIMDLSGFTNRSFAPPTPRQDMSAQMTQQQQTKPWWQSLASGLIAAPKFFAQAVTNEIPRAIAADFTNNQKALDNARMSLFGTLDRGKQLEKIAGNTGEIASYFLPGAAEGAGIGAHAASGALAGAGFGASGAAARGGSLSDVATGGATGAITGGAIGAGSGLLSNITNKFSDMAASKGTQMESRAGGFNIGQKINGKAILPNDVQNLEGWLASKNIPAGSAGSRLNAISDIKNTAGENINNAVSNSTATITNAERKQLTDQLMAEANKVAGPGKAEALAHANAYAKDIQAADTPQKLADIKRSADSQINYRGNSASVTPESQQIARVVRSQVNDTLNNAIPELAQHNIDFANASKLQDLMAAGAKNPQGLKVPILGSIGGQTKQAAESIIGKKLQGGGSPSIISSLINKAPIDVSPSRLLTAKLTSSAPSQPQTQQSSPQNLLNSAPQAGQDMTGNLLGQVNQGGDVTSQLLGQPVQSQQAGGPSLETLQQALAQDLQTTGGKNVNQLMQLAQLYGIVDKSGSPTTGPKLTTDQQKTVDAGNEASATLDTMLSQLGTIGGGAGRVGGLIGGIEGKLGLNNAVNAFNSTKTDTAIALAKAYSGSTRLPSPQTLKLIENSMPNYNDNPQEAQQKVDLIKQRLSAKLNSIPGASQLNQVSSSQGLLSQLNGQ